MYVDTHCHLTDARFDADRAETISRASAAGVEHIIEIACDPGKWQTALELAKSTPAISCAMGIHPQDASLMSPETFSLIIFFLLTFLKYVRRASALWSIF